MNKTDRSKLSQNVRSPQRMRVIFKNRADSKYIVQQSRNQPSSKVVVSVDHSQMQVDLTQHVRQLKDYVKNRMKTEYTDKFSGKQTLSKQLSGLSKINFLANAQSTSMEKLNNSGQRENSQSEVKSSRAGLQIASETAPIANTQMGENTSKYATLEEIEARIEQLMSVRLRQCLNFKSRSDWSLQCQLNTLIEALKNLKEQSSQNPQRDAVRVQKKIELLQKLMAQKMAESEIIKKYYLSKIARPSQKAVKTVVASLRQATEMGCKADWQKRQKMVSSQTNNQQSYVKPQRSAYNRFRHRSSYYNSDRHKQPLPRSSYKREYLVYGMSPVFASRPVQRDNMRSHSSCKVLNTSYQQNFGPKRSQRIDIRELDAYRDKFKNLPVSFMKKEEGGGSKLSRLANENRKSAIQSKQQEQKYRTVAYMAKYVKSQTQREFTKDPLVAVSNIKHRNLHRLKYEYRRRIIE